MGKLIYREEAWKKVGATDSQSPSGASEADVEVWTMDEHRLGLAGAGCVPRGTTDCSGELVFSVAMAVWLCSPSGEKRIGFCPKLISTCSIGYWHFANILALARTSKSFWRWIAGWHTSSQVEVPEGIHLEFMPSHSPELQPAELWPLTNEAVANQLFQTLDDLKRCFFSAAVPY